MRKYILIIALLTSFSNYSQELTDFKSLKEINEEEKELYDLLKQIVIKDYKENSDIHFFPLYRAERAFEKSEEYVEIKTLIYEKPEFKRTYQAGSGSKLVSLKLNILKNELREGSYMGDGRNSGGNNENVKQSYYLSIHKNRYSRESFLYLTSNNPFFTKNKYKTDVLYKKDVVKAFIDESIYGKIEYEFVLFANKDYAIIQRNGKVGIINNKNKALVPFEYKQIRLTQLGLLVVEDKRYFFIDFNNKKLSNEYAVLIFSLDEEGKETDELRKYIKAYTNKGITVLDSDFKEKLPPIYDALRVIYAKDEYPFQILAKRDNKILLIDFSTWQETSIIYDNIRTADGRLLIVEENSKSGLIKRDGTNVLEIKYDDIQPISNPYTSNYEVEFLTVKKDGKFAVFHSEKLVTDFEYDEIVFEKKVLIVKSNNKYGIITPKGEILAPVKYDKIEHNYHSQKWQGKIGDKTEDLELK